MMGKPEAIQWLEQQTGETIRYVPEERAPDRRERHLSVRLDATMAVALDAMAAERGMTVSQLVRDLVAAAVADRQSTAALDARALVDRLAADIAEIRRRLAG
jgi:predicted DNA-binding ribbon-helix-helix protein